MLHRYRLYVNSNLPYNPAKYPLPPPRGYNEIVARAMHVVAGSDLTQEARGWLLFVLPRIDTVTWSGTFEFHQLVAALAYPKIAVKNAQGELFMRGIVKWTKLDGKPSPITIMLAGLLALKPWAGTCLVAMKPDREAPPTAKES